jgi:hypothetical protein
MPYHTPAPIWEIYGANDFEQYVEKFVVRGCFHKDVPEDVRESYAVAEYIMAHSYYYHPMYEEALVKILRTLEMAVKMRCEQVGIPTLRKVKKKENKPEETKPQDFSILIDQLVKKEKSKHTTSILHGLRKLRNTFMHPKENMLMGATTINAIRHTLAQLNALFLPEQFFVEAQQKLENMQKQWQSFKERLSILDQAGKALCIYRSSVVEAYRAGEEWVYLCAFYPIFTHTKEHIEQMVMIYPVMLVLRDISLEEPDFIRGKNAADGTPVALLKTDHPEAVRVMEAFQAELALVSQADWQRYQFVLSHAVERERVKGRCAYWGR